MQCPFCKANEDRVLDSRSLGEGSAIRRRRQCLVCGKRYTTYERPEAAPRMVVKKDQRRELFSRDKILRGLIKACHKRNISVDELESLAAKIEADLWQESSTEVTTKVIGERVSEALKALDHVAYVRFASVYRDFKDVKEFLTELIPLVREKDLRESLARSPGAAEVSAALANPEKADGRPGGVPAGAAGPGARASEPEGRLEDKAATRRPASAERREARGLRRPAREK